MDLAAVVPNGDTAKYLDNMSRDGEYGDQMELVALSYALKRPIKVVTSCSVSNPKEAVQTINIGNSSASPILLGHLQKDLHYVSLEEQLSQQCDGQGKLVESLNIGYVEEGNSYHINFFTDLNSRFEKLIECSRFTYSVSILNGTCMCDYLKSVHGVVLLF